MSFLKKNPILKYGIGITLGFIICFLIYHYQHQPQHYQQQTLDLPELDDATEDNTVETNDGWITIRPRAGDTMGKIFIRAGLSQAILYKILDHNPHAKLFAHLTINQEVRFQIEHQTLNQLILPIDPLHYLTVLKDNQGYKTAIQTKNMTERQEFVSTPVKGSLYQTARTANIPYKLIDQINKIFFWQVQLAKEIRPGDRLNISYQAFYIRDQRAKIGDVLAVSYRHADGTVYTAIRHEHQNGEIGYYRPNGSSLKKAFERYPIHFSHISSSFGSARKHPILHYRRPHKGIDLAAPIGTPIYAIGDGRISFLGRQNGYGNVVKIIHDRQYTSLYAHMLKFPKGLRTGTAIKKGQLIGYVGQSGLANGPHCHYELHINRIPRNPATVSLPQALPIPKTEAYAFYNKAKQLLAQLQLFEDSQLATTTSPGKKILA